MTRSPARAGASTALLALLGACASDQIAPAPDPGRRALLLEAERRLAARQPVAAIAVANFPDLCADLDGERIEGVVRARHGTFRRMPEAEARSFLGASPGRAWSRAAYGANWVLAWDEGARRCAHGTDAVAPEALAEQLNVTLYRADAEGRLRVAALNATGAARPQAGVLYRLTLPAPGAGTRVAGTASQGNPGNAIRSLLLMAPDTAPARQG